MTIGTNKMKQLFKKPLTVAALLLGMIPLAQAETGIATGAAAQSGGAGAQARLDFRIIIPEFIFFRVGTAGATIDEIEFQPTVNDVQTAAAGIAATSGGDVSPGVVTVQLVSNAGGITITETNNGGGTGLTDGGGNFIDYAQIQSTNNAGTIVPPTLSNAGGNTSVVPPTSGNVTVENGQWTYTYDNPATPPAAGTYTGRVTYTAAVP